MLFMTGIVSNVICFAVIAVIGGTTFLIYKYLKRAEKSGEHQQTQIRRVVAKKDVNLSNIVKHFKGSMNSLTSVIDDYDKDSASVVLENIYQILDGHGDDDIHQWMNTFFANRSSWTEDDYKVKAGIVLDLLKKCGITSVQEDTVVWTDGMKDKYNKLMAVGDGQSCNVVAPYWVYEGAIYEKGIVIKS